MIEFTVNGERRELVEASPSMPLLWVLRDHLKLTGTKFGCGMGLCGACTVHLDGVAVRSCQLPVAAVAGHHITTIEACRPPNSIRCNWPGLPKMCRNAVTVNPGRSCPPPPCSIPGRR